MDYETKHSMVSTHAWETWTKNGLGLDDDARIETAKTVQDAVTNVYVEGLNVVSWLSRTLERLGG